jgi:hypothetical protein
VGIRETPEFSQNKDRPKFQPAHLSAYSSTTAFHHRGKVQSLMKIEIIPASSVPEALFTSQGSRSILCDEIVESCFK